MFETYRMLGEQREAELLREARRLQAGASVRSNARRHRARLGSFRARARRATRKVEWLRVDGLSGAAIEVENENQEL
jgi:hypothetical protein